MIRIALVLAMGLFFVLPHDAMAARKSYIVGYRQNPGEKDHSKISKMWGKVKRSHKVIPALTVELQESDLEQLRRDPDVAFVEENAVVSLPPSVSLAASPEELGAAWGVQRIGAAEAAARNVRGTGIKVGIIDSGIDCSHPDIADNCRGGYNFLFGGPDAFDDHYQSHGTHVAGIVAAKDNGSGVVGVAPDAELYALKVLDASGFGDVDAIIAAIEWAIANKLDVVTLSIGSPDSVAFRAVCDNAAQAGVVVVAAAGNSSNSIMDYPALYDSVIAVSATDATDQLAWFSSYGDKVELAAPGDKILSTMRGGGYGVLSGTSQAVPHVAGVAALVLSQGMNDQNGNGTRVDEVRARLNSSATDLGTVGRDQLYGYGLVNAAQATAVPSVPSITLTAKVSTLRPYTDNVTKAALDKGDYEVTIRNMGLISLGGKVVVGKKILWNQSFLETFRRTPDAVKTIRLTLPADGELILVPLGKVGTSADIVITRK